jgi:hypothetical protein
MSNDFQNSKTLAKAVKDVSGDPKLVARPYSRFEPDGTIWWLIPSTECPAYKYGKLFFETKGTDIFCGYNAEKGVSAGNGFHLNKFIMDSNWIWNEFMASLVNKDVETITALRKMVSKALEHYLVISVSFVPLADDDDSGWVENKNDFKSSQVEFKIDRNLDLKCLREKTETNKNQKEVADFIFGLQNETNLSALASKINEAESAIFRWFWVDIFFGVYVPIAEGRISVADLWEDYLEPWELWLRKGNE